MSFAYMTATELKGLLAARDISPVELVEDTLSPQEALEPQINAFVTRTPEVALEAARAGRAGDRRGRGGRDRGPAHLGQGPGGDGGRALDLRLPALRRQRGGLRRARGGAGQGGRRLHRRQVHHQRVRLQGGLRQPAHRDHPQSVEPGEDIRRFQRRRCRERRRRAHALRGLHRWRRLRAHSLCALRALRHQGAVRPGAGAPGLGGTDTRPCGRNRAHGAGRRAAARRHGGPRPPRCFRRRRARAGFLAACDAGAAKGMRIAWSPTLGYAEPEPEIVGALRGRRPALRGAGVHRRAGRGRARRRPGRDLDGGVLRRHRHQAEGPDDGAPGGAGSGRGRR